jgi:hypothetical protein
VRIVILRPPVALATAALLFALGSPAVATAAADPPPFDPLGLLVPPPDGPADPAAPDLPGQLDPAAPDDAERLLRRAIVATARGELARPRARETGDNCSFYNAAVEPDGRRCGIEWCTQFLRWVWREAGAAVDGLSYRPVSLREYGRRHGTWHPGEDLSGVRPGDAVVWRLDQPGRLGHAGIVVAVRGKRITTVGGNEKGGTVRRTTWRVGYGTASGYTSPVPQG